MDFFISTKQRTDKEELMDDFSIGGDLLRDTLDKLEKINRWLGGNKVTVNGLKELLKKPPKRTRSVHCRYRMWSWRYFA